VVTLQGQSWSDAPSATPLYFDIHLFTFKKETAHVNHRTYLVFLPCIYGRKLPSLLKLASQNWGTNGSQPGEMEHFMKAVRAPSLIFTIAAALAIHVYAQCQFTNGLVAYYPFNGNANDESTNANNGTPQNAVLTADRFGVADHAYEFNGVNAYISAPNQSYLSFPNGEFSISLWAAMEGVPSLDAFLIGLDNGNNGGAQKWIFFYGQLNIPYPPPGDYVGFTVNQSIQNSDYWLATTQYAPVLRSWHHYVITQMGSTYTLCIDGVSASGSTNYVYSGLTQFSGVAGPSTIPSGITAPLTIGEAEGGGYFHGKLDDIRIYNFALSSNEVAQLFAFESTPPCIPHRATAAAIFTNGIVVGVNVIDGGCGYTNTPLVLILGGGGTGAAATAVVSNGVVASITVTDAGAGYTSAPSIYIYSPLGLQVGLIKAVAPSFSDLLIGTNYQLQVSSDLTNWTDEGSIFTATNPTTVYPQYFDVTYWGQLFFRLQVAP
jgi:Concanavalin A-like lectin/glucanases superfamily